MPKLLVEYVETGFTTEKGRDIDQDTLPPNGSNAADRTAGKHTDQLPAIVGQNKLELD